MDTPRTLLQVNGYKVPLEALKLELKTNEGLEIIKRYILKALISQEVKRLGIPITDAEIQEEVNQMRLERGLADANRTYAYLKDHNLTLEEFGILATSRIETRKLQKHVATEEAIYKTFVDNKALFEAREIAHAILKDENQARELICQLNEKRLIFSEVTEKFSLDEATKKKAGYVGLVNRTQVPNVVAMKIFANNPPEYLGPISVENHFRIVRIISTKSPELDSSTKNLCEQIIFREYIDRLYAEGKVDFLKTT